MEKQNSPGLWIAAAALGAVLVVMVAIPGKKAVVPAEVASPEQAKRPEDTITITSTEQLAAPPKAEAPAVPSDTLVPSSPLPPRDPDDPVPPPKIVTPADRENSLRVLDNIQFALRDYRSALGENPVGTNAEITSSLLGNNRKQAKVPLPEGANVNTTGEMLDLWGTPYFFHQQSATKMEIRSAGPDQKMWTLDDLGM